MVIGSVHDQMSSPMRFDCNATPLAPIGIQVLAHESPDNQGRWAPHGMDAWGIGPALEHHQCHRVWIWDMKAERQTNTVAWFPPPHIKMPVASKANLIVASVNNLTRTSQLPFHGIVDLLTDSNTNALAQMTSPPVHHTDSPQPMGSSTKLGGSVGRIRREDEVQAFTQTK
jgi:hypothetical protein